MLWYKMKARRAEDEADKEIDAGCNDGAIALSDPETRNIPPIVFQAKRSQEEGNDKETMLIMPNTEYTDRLIPGHLVCPRQPERRTQVLSKLGIRNCK